MGSFDSMFTLDRTVDEIREKNNRIVEYFLKQEYQEDAYNMMSELRKLPVEVFKNANAFAVSPDTRIIDLGDLVDNATGFTRDKSLVYKDRFVYPIYDCNKRVMGFTGYDPESDTMKYLDSHTYGYNSKAFSFYGIGDIQSYLVSGKDIYVTEGIVDCIILRYLGYQAIATLGSHYNIFLTKLITKYRRKFIIVIDKDDAGTKGLLRLRRMAGPVRAIVTCNQKDINDEIRYVLKDISKFDLKTSTRKV